MLSSVGGCIGFFSQLESNQMIVGKTAFFLRAGLQHQHLFNRPSFPVTEVPALEYPLGLEALTWCRGAIMGKYRGFIFVLTSK